MMSSGELDLDLGGDGEVDWWPELSSSCSSSPCWMWSALAMTSLHLPEFQHAMREGWRKSIKVVVLSLVLVWSVARS